MATIIYPTHSNAEHISNVTSDSDMATPIQELPKQRVQDKVPLLT
ncbi:MAG: hypothetical protein ACSLEY_00515 [Candidatus Saccharimonadales bacterium]